MPPPTSNRTKLTCGILALTALIAAIALYLFDPATTAAYPGCPLHSLTGLDCPTCGGLRATHLLLHGQVRAAFAMNPLLFFAIPIVGLFCIRPALARPRWIPWAAGAILIAWFIWRNWL
jgi:Protein of unknown function (DUF2752)